MSSQSYRDEELELARQRFGRFIRQWMHSGGWSTKTPAQWAKEAGLPQISNNTVSFIWNGTQPKTSPKFFAILGYLNQRLADRDYGPITSRDLRDRVSSLEPVRHANGQPWGAVDFFACYIGHLEPPAAFDTGPPEKARLLTPELAQRISSCKQEVFERNAQARGLSKAEAWAQVKEHCQALSGEQLDAFQQVLSGWRSWTPEEMEGLKTEDGYNAAVLALEQWCGMDLHAELQTMACTLD
jgi:hypothetical protein